MRELSILCLEGSWWIFSSNKSPPANRKKGFYTSSLSKNDKIWRIFCMKQLRILSSFKKIRIKIQNQKPKAVPRPIQWYRSHADLIWPDNTFKSSSYFDQQKEAKNSR